MKKFYTKIRTDNHMSINVHGTKEWRLPNGDLHREDGPAIKYADGGEQWWINGELHREGGPAITHATGSKFWYINGKRHREDGPAIEYKNGDKYWFLKYVGYSEEEFNIKQDLN